MLYVAVHAYLLLRKIRMKSDVPTRIRMIQLLEIAEVRGSVFTGMFQTASANIVGCRMHGGGVECNSRV